MRDWAEDQIEIEFVWIRHGQTRANEAHRYLGRTDEPLSENGRGQLLFYKGQDAYPDVNYLFASPMKRCIETAQILYPQLCPVVIPEWEEIDFGRFEYKAYTELAHDTRYQEWVDSKGTLAFPEGEGREDFILRCKRGFHRMYGILCQAAKDGIQPGDAYKGRIRAGAVVHGGTIMALLSSYGGKPYFDCQVQNGRGYSCKITGRGNTVQIQDVAEQFPKGPCTAWYKI